MPLHVIIVSLIATSLLMGCLSLLQDAVSYARHLHATRTPTQPPEYPHPIVLEYPTPGPALQPRFVPVTRPSRLGPWQEDARRRA
jgi:hypothetical protein